MVYHGHPQRPALSFNLVLDLDGEQPPLEDTQYKRRSPIEATTKMLGCQAIGHDDLQLAHELGANLNADEVRGGHECCESWNSLPPGHNYIGNN